ncbi:MAG: zinc ribbon domain-containing protein [Vicinamibacterales bacterium]
MNSTSSSSAASASAKATAGPPTLRDGGKGRATLHPWQFYVTASFLAAAAAVWISPPASPAALLFISLAIAGAGACAAALHTLLTAVSGRSAPETGVAGSVRETLEREKLLVLRSLKDLEFDRAMGKMSAADAAPLEARLRARALAIMHELDGRESLRARIEEDIARNQTASRTPQATGLCGCGTANDADARFCKACGARL